MNLRSSLQLPKEHGSWGMFFIPLTLGLLVGRRWHADVSLFAIAASAAFLAREPFMISWRRWRRGTENGRALRIAGVYAVAAVLAGVPLLPRYPWLAVLGCAGTALYAWHAEASMRGEGRSVGVELLAIATSMLTAPAAFYVSTGRLDGTAFALWLMTFGYFGSAVFYVKMRLTAARARASVQRHARIQCVAWHLALLLSATILPPITRIGYALPIARAFWYAVRPAASVNLRQIGWMEVAYSLIFLVAVAIGFPA